jgi:hypothetical protein
VLVFFLFVSGTDIVKQRAQRLRELKQWTYSGERAAPAGGTAWRPSGAAAEAGLTRQEFEQNVPRLAPKFAEIDTDRNGRVTTEELQTYLRRGPAVSGKY